MSESVDNEPLVELWDAVQAKVEELKVREDQLREKEVKLEEKEKQLAKM